jgi:hypothetical protein
MGSVLRLSFGPGELSTRLWISGLTGEPSRELWDSQQQISGSTGGRIDE